MSVYGDLSKAQRELLQDLFHGSFSDRGKSRLGRIQAKRAVSIVTAHQVDSKSRQTARNLAKRGFVETEGMRPLRVWLTLAGIDLMRSLDYRHSRARGCRGA